jgi:hypothetical protein
MNARFRIDAWAIIFDVKKTYDGYKSNIPTLNFLLEV